MAPTLTSALIRQTGLYDAFCPTPLQAHMIALHFTRRYVDQVFEGNTASLGEAALRQSLVMVRLGNHEYHDFLEEYDIFRRRPTPEESEQEKYFLSLQVNQFYAQMTDWNLPDDATNVDQFVKDYPSLALWSVVKNNLLKSSTAFHYDDKMDLRANLYRAEIHLGIKDLADQVRNSLDLSLHF